MRPMPVSTARFVAPVLAVVMAACASRAAALEPQAAPPPAPRVSADDATAQRPPRQAPLRPTRDAAAPRRAPDAPVRRHHGAPARGLETGDAEALTLTIGQARVLDTGPVRRLAVGNGKILQATALDERQVLLLPEASGRSSLHVWPRQGAVRRYAVTVLGGEAASRFDAIQALLGPAENLDARVAGDAVVIEGNDLSASQLARVKAIVERFPEVLDLATGSVSDRMIAMDVRFVEIKKSALQNLGVRWSGTANGPSFGIIGDIYRSDALGRDGLAEAIGQRAGAVVAPFASTLTLASSVGSMLSFLVENGHATVLAEPRLSCRSGGSARFIAGGELPIPMSAGLGTVSVSFKEYGIKFDFAPTALPDGVIAARIVTEVSAVDFDVQVKDVPGIVKRRAETEIRLREGQTMVIAGLLTEESSRHVDKVAGLAEIPVLGHLFRSRAFRERQTDLAVFVTPRYVALDPESVAVTGAKDAQTPSDPAGALEPASGSHAPATGSHAPASGRLAPGLPRARVPADPPATETAGGRLRWLE